jgi:hypothetical protein
MGRWVRVGAGVVGCCFFGVLELDEVELRKRLFRTSTRSWELIEWKLWAL